MQKRLSRLASELGKLEIEMADAGCEEHANELGLALEKIEGVLEGLSALKV